MRLRLRLCVRARARVYAAYACCAVCICRCICAGRSSVSVYNNVQHQIPNTKHQTPNQTQLFVFGGLSFISQVLISQLNLLELHLCPSVLSLCTACEGGVWQWARCPCLAHQYKTCVFLGCDDCLLRYLCAKLTCPHTCDQDSADDQHKNCGCSHYSER